VLNILLVLTLGVLGILVAVKKLREKPSEKAAPLPQPLVTRRDTDYVPRHEFVRLEKEVHELRVTTSQGIETLIAEGHRRAERIHDRLTTLVDGQADLRGRLEQFIHDRPPARKSPHA